MLICAQTDKKSQVIWSVAYRVVCVGRRGAQPVPARPSVWFWRRRCSWRSSATCWRFSAATAGRGGDVGGLLPALRGRLPLDYASVGAAGCDLGYWTSQHGSTKRGRAGDDGRGRGGAGQSARDVITTAFAVTRDAAARVGRGIPTSSMRYRGFHATRVLLPCCHHEHRPPRLPFPIRRPFRAVRRDVRARDARRGAAAARRPSTRRRRTTRRSTRSSSTTSASSSAGRRGSISRSG